MVHGWSPLIVGELRAYDWLEASFSQGDRWNRLISKYITVMPSSGRKLEEQNVIGDASFAAIHAMSAKVGEAAKASQPVVPRACLVLALPLSAAADIVILQLPIDCLGSRPVRERAGM
jgi:hypothetical protein